MAADTDAIEPIFPPPVPPDPLGQVRCHRCRRVLTHPDSVARGLGPICAAKWIWELPVPVDEKLAKLEALRRQVRETGEISEGDLVELIEKLKAGQQELPDDPAPDTASGDEPDFDPQEEPARPDRRLPVRDPEPDMAVAERIFRETFARKMPGYEPREPQIQLAREVARALATGSHLVGEAGTGTGKSFAVLVPAVHWTREMGKRVVVSTGTIALQEQYMGKDVPFLQQVLADEMPFSAALIKGKGNYLCRLKAGEAAKESAAGTDPELDRVLAWVRETSDGDKSELPFVPADDVWRRVNVDDSCLRHKCPLFEECGFYQVRERAKRAQILVCNHHLLMYDLPYGIFPQYGALILDEAHHLEDIASNTFGVEISQFRLPALCRDIERLEHPDIPTDRLQHIRQLNSSLMGHFAGAEVSGRPLEKEALSRVPGQERYSQLAISLVAELKQLGDELATLDWSWADDRTKARCQALVERVTGLAGDFQDVFNPTPESTEQNVAWVEVERGRQEPRVTLHLNPIDVGPGLQDLLWDPLHAVICTSATLSTGTNFNYFKRMVGLNRTEREVLELHVTSPFDYPNQALLYVPRGLPEPREEERWTNAIIGITRDVLQATGGRAFVLFTSYKQLKAVYESLATELEQAGYVIFRQGDMPRTQLLDAFKEAHAAGGRPILFATGTFWEGVSVEDEALSCVVIDKLPFQVPSDPIAVAKAEALKRNGEDPFMHYTVPQAIIRVKQGFGRLIRTRRDRGLVAILDPRIRTKGYGRQFLRSLPPAREIYHLGDVLAFLQGG